VKLCFLSYYAAQREAGKLADSPELSRALTDMITVSSNDATGFVVDSITGTTSGPEIADSREWDRWKAKRNVVNDWFRARGYTNLNANQKTFCEDAYGREQAFREGGKNRNRMTAGEAARIFKEGLAAARTTSLGWILPVEPILQPLAREGIERRERLVKKKQRCLGGQRPCDRDPLLLSPADLPDLAVGGALQPHAGQQVITALGTPLPWHVGVLERQVDVAADRAPGEQPGLLEHHARRHAGCRRGTGNLYRTLAG